MQKCKFAPLFYYMQQTTYHPFFSYNDRGHYGPPKFFGYVIGAKCLETNIDNKTTVSGTIR